MISWRVYSRYGGALLKGEGGYFIEELFLLQCSLSHVFENSFLVLKRHACLCLFQLNCNGFFSLKSGVIWKFFEKD